MRTFIIKARKGTTSPEKVKSQVGGKAHLEVVAHAIMNAFFIASDFRKDVEAYVILDSSADFPRTIHLSANEGLSFSGFHEAAILEPIESALKLTRDLAKNQSRKVATGITIHGYGFEKLMQELLSTKTCYLLEPKGTDIRALDFDPNSCFILSDHLALPKKIVTSLKRKGLKSISLGKKMLFASQCVTLINHEIDRTDS